MNLGCGGCGRNNPPEARFCIYCGAELAVAAEEPPASDDRALPEFPTAVAPAQPTTAPTDNAGVWQRIVFGLMALLGGGLVWFGFATMREEYEFGYSPSLGELTLLVGLILVGMIVGTAFGIAAVRPPRGILRRLLVGLGCLVIFSVAGAVIAAVVYFVWFFSW